MGTNVILWNAVPLSIHLAQFTLRPEVALLRCLAMPFQCRLVVVRHSQATGIQQSEIVLRSCIATATVAPVRIKTPTSTTSLIVYLPFSTAKSLETSCLSLGCKKRTILFHHSTADCG